MCRNSVRPGKWSPVLSGGELIIVAMAVVALVVLAASAIAGIVARVVRGRVSDPPSGGSLLRRVVRPGRRRR